MEQPNCLQTERILIACLLLRGDSEVYDSVCSIVSEDDFYNSKNKNLFSCIKAIFAKSEEIDEVLLLEEIRKRKLDIVLEDIYGIQSTTILYLKIFMVFRVLP